MDAFILCSIKINSGELMVSQGLSSNKNKIEYNIVWCEPSVSIEQYFTNSLPILD